MRTAWWWKAASSDRRFRAASQVWMQPIGWCCSQAVRPRSAKPLFPGSIPGSTSKRRRNINKSDAVHRCIRFVHSSAGSIRHRHIFRFRLRGSLIDQALQRDPAQIIGHDPIEPLPHGQRHAKAASLTKVRIRFQALHRGEGTFQVFQHLERRDILGLRDQLIPALTAAGSQKQAGLTYCSPNLIMNYLRAINRSNLRHSTLKYVQYSCGFVPCL